RFNAAGDLVADGGASVEIRLPAALFREHEFVVEGALEAASADRVVQFQVGTAAPAAGRVLDGKTPCVAGAAAAARLAEGLEEFRRCFPLFLCFPHITPE